MKPLIELARECGARDIVIGQGQVRCVAFDEAQLSALVDQVIEECAVKCEQRANSLREGAAVARQCALDIRSMRWEGKT